MAVYKVPQDVEAEDKLLGPFSFKQFIFLLITVGSIGVAYGLSRISLPLVIIPLPVILFFGALALPLRKDQPMEVYLAAIISHMVLTKFQLKAPQVKCRTTWSRTTSSRCAIRKITTTRLTASPYFEVSSLGTRSKGPRLRTGWPN